MNNQTQSASLFPAEATPNTDLLNEDGVSVKNCHIIYAPAGQAGEYAPLAANPYKGCGHRCAYCYVPEIIRMSRNEFNSGAAAKPDYLKLLRHDAQKYMDAGITEQVLLSFTSDPYHPGDNSLTRSVIKVLQEYGLAVCTLTKGGSRSLRDLDLFRSDRDSFASTLTSLDNAFSLKWEPGAALPDDRLSALKKFHAAGIFTWVSLEPTLDTEASLEIVNLTHDFVDLYKIGRVNYLPMTKTTDWRSYTLKMIELCQRLGVKHYIKHDLQCYLPAGYNNPKRIAQHN